MSGTTAPTAYISKEAVLKNQRWNGRLDEYVVFVRDIEEIPAADVVESKPIKTNADRIRAMSDEELAEFLAEWNECGATAGLGYNTAQVGSNYCTCDAPGGGDISGECAYCALCWLREEARE